MPPTRSKQLVPTGPRHLSQINTSSGEGVPVLRPTTSRALVLRNGRNGTMGSGELVPFRKRLSGKEKLDLLAGDLVQRAVLSPFRLEQCLDIAGSQCDAYLDVIANLKDPALFCDVIKAELDARSLLDPQRLDPSFIASIIAAKIHNTYMLAAGWRIVRDTLVDFARSGLSDDNVKIKLKNSLEFRQHFLALYDMSNILVSLSQEKAAVLATTTPHYARYFKKVNGAAPDEADVRFDWGRLREACLSFMDSIIIELCFPRPPYPRDILFSILREAVEEAPKEARRFPQLFWDAIGDFSTSVELHSLLEAVLLGREEGQWKATPRNEQTRYTDWLSAHLHSANASDMYGNWEDMVYPLENIKRQLTLDEIWRLINLNYNSVSGKDIEVLWGLSNALDPSPQWHAYYKHDLHGHSVSDESGKKALTLTRKQLDFVEDDSDDSSSMPSLHTISGSSESSEHEDSDDPNDTCGTDDESGYDTGEEEELREMLRKAMDIVHDVDFYDSAKLNAGSSPLAQVNDQTDNPFVKLLGSLRGRLFSSNPKLKVFEHMQPKKPRPVSEGIKQGTILANMDEDDGGGKEGTAQARKKRKKKKPKKKVVVDQTTLPNVTEEPLLVSSATTKRHVQHPASGTNTAAAKESKPSKTVPGQLAPTSLSLPVEPTVAQSARSYIKAENLNVQKKVKSRSDQASIFSNDAKDGKKGMFARFRLGRVKDSSEEEQSQAKQSWFAKLSKKATSCMHQLLRTSQDEKQGIAPMKWDHFVALMKEMGFTYDPTTAGSSVRFIPPDRRDKPITIHKPHPDPTLQPIKLKEIASRLKRYYGWSKEDFLAQAR
ncbi:hypothetical protein APHAL10511_003669 [Amanita phalloides]|nr:hypothetical protein APHAL10511_003669 [Amanita phalloides]